MQTPIPLLQNVRVASPCNASWEGMESIEGERVKFCLHCAKNVYNLSEMTQAEAEGLLRRHEGKLCVRYYQRRDGTILTRDCPIGAQAVRMALIRRSSVAAGLFTLMFGAMAAITFEGSHERNTIGAMAVKPEVMTLPTPPVASGRWIEGEAITTKPEPPVPLMGAVAAPVRMGKVAVSPEHLRGVAGEIKLPMQGRATTTSVSHKSHDYDAVSAKDSTDEAILKPHK